MKYINRADIDEDIIRNIIKASDEEILENLDHFFEYLEDSNRYYAIPLAHQLGKRFDLIKNKLYEVFSKENPDACTKRNIMVALFGFGLEENQIKEVDDILLRIINDPSLSELNEYLNISAQIHFDYLYASDEEYLKLYEEIIEELREGDTLAAASFPLVSKRFHLIKNKLRKLLSENEKDINFKDILIKQMLNRFYFKKEHILEFIDDFTRIIENPLPGEQEKGLDRYLKDNLNDIC